MSIKSPLPEPFIVNSCEPKSPEPEETPFLLLVWRYLEPQFLPLFAIGKNAINYIEPYFFSALEVIHEICQDSKGRGLNNILIMSIGLLMCFYGGSFVILISATEAIRLVGWDKLHEKFQLMWRSFQTTKDESRRLSLAAQTPPLRDIVDKVDIPPEMLISPSELVPCPVEWFKSPMPWMTPTDEIGLFLKNMDIMVLSSTIGELWAGTLAITATLRVGFCQTTTLGMSLGDVITPYFFLLTRELRRSFPPQWAHWAPVLVTWCCRGIGILFAWTMRRFILTLHSGMRGANLFVKNALRLAWLYGLADDDFTESSPRGVFLTLLIGFLGVSGQLASNYSLPLIIRLIFLPLSILESALAFCIGITYQTS